MFSSVQAADTFSLCKCTLSVLLNRLKRRGETATRPDFINAFGRVPYVYSFYLQGCLTTVEIRGEYRFGYYLLLNLDHRIKVVASSFVTGCTYFQGLQKILVPSLLLLGFASCLLQMPLSGLVASHFGALDRALLINSAFAKRTIIVFYRNHRSVCP